MKKFKKTLALMLVSAMVASAFAGCGSSDVPNSTSIVPGQSEADPVVTDSKAGTYTGNGQGFGGSVTATVTLGTDGTIRSVEVDHEKETENIGTIAIDMLPGQIVEAQSIKLDAVASATVTSNAIFAAVTEALAQAGIDASTLEPQAAASIMKTAETVDIDVVVIGAGGAGMTSAINLKQAGYSVVILEKMPMVGGNTIKATGGMNAADTDVQAALEIEDSVEVFISDTMEGGSNVNDIALVTVMAEESSNAINWLDSIGAPLPEVTYSGGATNKRIHRPEGGAAVGQYLVEHLSRNVDSIDIPVYLNTTATELTMEDGVVTGVIAGSNSKDYTFNAQAVVLATGGFGANEELYTKYREDLVGFVTTNTPGATGDGIIMAEAVGASLTDIGEIQIHPTVEQTTSILITESVRGDGAILVNTSAERFTDELLTRDVVSANVIAQDESFAYAIFDQRLRDGLAAVESYVSAGITTQADSIEDLAAAIGLDSAALAATVETWNGYVTAGSDVDYGRTAGVYEITEGPFYAIKIAPGVHHTMGGVTINTSTEVIDTNGAVIPGIYAAGEVVGGVHGANRIGGNAVTDIIVFGKISAETIIENLSGADAEDAA